MHYLWCDALQHLLHVGKTLGYMAAFPQLFRHQQFPVTKSNDLAVRDTLNCRDMLICHFSASDYCYT